MSERPKTSITFFLKGEQYAMRTWWHVPRAGDEVMLHHKGKKIAFEVVRVVWGVESEQDELMDWQRVNIEIKAAGKKP